MARYRLSIAPPNALPPIPLILQAGDSVQTTVEYRGLIWTSTWSATEMTVLEFTNWEDISDN
jgi:hypothetical protein